MSYNNYNKFFENNHVDLSGNGSIINAASIEIEGLTNNEYETSIVATNTNSSRTATLPDRDFTFNKTEDLSSGNLPAGVIVGSSSLSISADLSMAGYGITNLNNISHSAGNKTQTLASGATYKFNDGSDVIEINPDGFNCLKLYSGLDVNGNSINNGGTSLMSTTTLGSSVVNSSLQNLGAQNQDLNMAGNNIDNLNWITNSGSSDIQMFIEGNSNFNIRDSSNLYFSLSPTSGLRLYNDLLLNDGSAAAPSLTFSSDTNSGFYKQTADELHLSLSGAEQASFSTSGLDIVSGNSYSIGGTNVLSAATLESGVHNSSLKNLGVQDANLDLGGRNLYHCEVITNNGDDELLNGNTGTLGAVITNSSITGVGALDTGSIVAGFGAINIGSSTFQSGDAIIREPATGSTDSKTNTLEIGRAAALTGGTIGRLRLSGHNNSSNYRSWDIETGGLYNSSSDYTHQLRIIDNATTEVIIDDDGLNLSTGNNLRINSESIVENGTINASQYNAKSYVNSGDLVFNAISSKNVYFRQGGSNIANANNTRFNLASGIDYRINDVSVLTNNTLGSGIVNSSLTSTGALNGFSMANTSIAYIDSPYVVSSTDSVILCNSSAGAISILLPAAASSNGRTLNIKDKGSAVSYNITVDANSSETIDGALTQTISVNYDSLTITCDGSNWYVL